METLTGVFVTFIIFMPKRKPEKISLTSLECDYKEGKVLYE